MVPLAPWTASSRTRCMMSIALRRLLSALDRVLRTLSMFFPNRSMRMISDWNRVERAAARGSSRRSLIRDCAPILFDIWFMSYSRSLM